MGRGKARPGSGHRVQRSGYKSKLHQESERARPSERLRQEGKKRSAQGQTRAERSAVKAVAEAEAEKIVLVSCNPATLARDLGIIVGTLRDDGGSLVKVSAPQSRWNIECVIPFDMFPQTKWCETLVVLSRK